jgi:hypothetical protein
MDTAGQAQAGEVRRVPVPWLAGLSGRIRLDVGGKPVRVLEVQDGTVSIRPAAGEEEADAALLCDSEETVEGFKRGQLNPVVAALQGRARTTGNRELAIKVIFGLQSLTAPPPTEDEAGATAASPAAKEG